MKKYLKSSNSLVIAVEHTNILYTDREEGEEISLEEFWDSGGITTDENPFGDYYKLDGVWIKAKIGEYPPSAIESIKTEKITI